MVVGEMRLADIGCRGDEVSSDRTAAPREDDVRSLRGRWRERQAGRGQEEEKEGWGGGGQDSKAETGGERVMIL